MTTRTDSYLHLFLIFLIAGIAVCGSLPAKASGLSAAAPAAEDAGKDANAAAVPAPDALGRTTPRGMVEGFLAALANQDFDKAGQYLNVKDLPYSQRKNGPVPLTQQLQTLLDKGGWFYPGAMLSNEQTGKLNEDGITDDLDRIGSLRGHDKTIDILAQRVKQDDGSEIWLISSQTLSELPDLIDGKSAGEPRINKILPDSLVDNKWGGAPIGHWLATGLLMIASYLAAWFLILVLFAGVKRLWTTKCTTPAGVHFMDTVRLPFSLYAAVWIFALSCLFLDISIIIRQQASILNVIVSWIALVLFALRLVDIFSDIAQKKIISNGRYFGFSSIVYFIRRIIKFVLAIVVLFVVLDNLGVDVTAGLAALGIGGIALALGAQKTLENFIGSVAIVLDQPMHIGDFCKIGDTSGTVEDIGMRSTRIRTNERTLVTIPNGDLSTQRIENYARRTRFLVNRKFELRYDAKSGQIRSLVSRMKDIIFANDTVSQDPFPIRYLGFGPNGHLIETFFYVNLSDYNEFLKVQQELMLQFLDAVEELGLYFTIPAQTFLPALDQTGPKPVLPPASAQSKG